MTKTLISVSGLGKTYRVYDHPWHRLREALTGRSQHTAFVALENVGFELRRGESLGIIGQNGAGKSTLLKILSGVSSPTCGEITVAGKLASLLELGMGFHPEFTGLHNIRLNAAIMGLSEAEVEHQIPAIVAFSELGDFIDRPVKTYSTGMVMRLGFAIAIHVEPEILIIDEALSVGDGYFQKKCKDRLVSFVESGRTLLFCSHAMYYVSAFCQRALWLRHGRVAALGPVEEVVRAYENFLLTKSEKLRDTSPDRDAEIAGTSGEPRDEGRVAKLTQVRQSGDDGETRTLRYRQPWTLEIEWQTNDPNLGFHVAVGVDRIDGVQICSFATHRDQLPPYAGETRYAVELRLPELPILKGEFDVYVFLFDEQGLHVYDQAVVHRAFTVEPTEEYKVGLIQIEHSWGQDTARAGSTETGSPVSA